MKNSSQYIKEKKLKKPRPHKVTSVNLEFYQVKTLTDENLNLSSILRDFLDDYLSKNFPVSYAKNKKQSEALK